MPVLTVSVQGIAKPSGYTTFVLEFDAPYVASIGLELPEGCAFYNEVGNSEPRVNCVPFSGLCWEVSGQFRGTARVYFFSTWKPGQVAILTAVLRRQEETIRMPVPVVIGGGTAPAATPTPRATVTRTPGAAQVWQAREWTLIQAVGDGPDLTFLVRPESPILGRASMRFCDTDFECCTSWVNPTDDWSWGKLLVRHLSNPGCTELRWVWTPMALQVEDIRRGGSW